MYRKSETNWLKHIDFLIVDLLALQIASFLAFFIRFGLNEMYSTSFYFRIALLLLIINSCVAFFDDSYRSILRRGYLQEAKSSIKHVFFIMTFLICYLYFSKQAEVVSRKYFFLLVLFSVVFMYLFRCVYKIFIKRHKEKVKEDKYQMLVLTNSQTICQVLDNLKESKYYIAGICIADQNQIGTEIEGIPVVSEFDGLLDYIRQNIVDGLFVDLPESTSDLEHILDTCSNMGVSTHLGLACNDKTNAGQIVEKIGKYTVLTQSIRVVTTRQLFVKRAVDICAGLAGVIVTGIAFLFVAPAIYLASPGPIFFSQTRVGRNGRKFKIYKFRSMYMDAEERKKELMKQNKIADGMMFKMDDDPRIIKGIGHFIRDYSIDELPQLWNVLKGEMSLIGTRPPTVEEYEKYHYHHKVRLAIKPGITGMWQVSGRSNITDFEQVVALDESYITNWSLGLDLKILLKTVQVVLKKDGAS